MFVITTVHFYFLFPFIKRCKCKSFIDDAKKHVNVAEPMMMTQIDLSRGKDKNTVSQQQFQPRMQITQDFIFDKLICYSYVQEYVIE